MVSTQQNTINNTEQTTQSSSAVTVPSVAGENTTASAETPTVNAVTPAGNTTNTAENTTVPAESVGNATVPAVSPLGNTTVPLVSPLGNTTAPVGNTTVASSESSVVNTTVSDSTAGNSTSTKATNETANANVTAKVDDQTNNVTTSVLGNEETSTEASGGFFLVSHDVGNEEIVNIVVNNVLTQPTTGADQVLDVAESDNSDEVYLYHSDNNVTDLYNDKNTPTYNDDLIHTSHTEEPGRIAMSNTSAEEIFTQNDEDDVTSSVLELLSSTEYDVAEITNTNTTRGINSSEFEELEVRGISGKESNVDRQDYAQSRSLKLGEGGNTDETQWEEEVARE